MFSTYTELMSNVVRACHEAYHLFQRGHILCPQSQMTFSPRISLRSQMCNTVHAHKGSCKNPTQRQLCHSFATKWRPQRKAYAIPPELALIDIHVEGAEKLVLCRSWAAHRCMHDPGSCRSFHMFGCAATCRAKRFSVKYSSSRIPIGPYDASL